MANSVGRLNLPIKFLFLVLLIFRYECQVQAQEGYEYVQEVLEEDYRQEEESEHYYSDPAQQMEDEEIRRQQEAQQQQMEEERIAREKAEQNRLRREREFEKELSRMSEEKQKAARRQKKKDAKVVKQVLQSARKEQHYQVLGLRNCETNIAPRSIKLAMFQLEIPGLTLFHITSKQIRKAFRARSLSVHPDKNKDGQAEEAFVAVENSASILSDDGLRQEYDTQQRLLRRQRKEQITRISSESLQKTVQFVSRAIRVFKTVLGPFAFPVFVIGALVI